MSLTARMMEINDQLVGECKSLPLFSISPKVWFEFISDRQSNFSDNNLLVPNLELPFQGVYNEESDLTFMTLKQNETLQLLRSLLALCSWDEGQEGWAGLDLPVHFAIYSPRRASELQKDCTWFGLAPLTQVTARGWALKGRRDEGKKD